MTAIPVTRYEVAGIPCFVFHSGRALISGASQNTTYLPYELFNPATPGLPGQMILTRGAHAAPLAVYIYGNSTEDSVRLNHHACLLKPGTGGVYVETDPKTLYYALEEHGRYVVELGNETYAYEVQP